MRPNPEIVFSAEEREAMLKKMQHASNVFYNLAAATHCHPFLEFCGLMNEYIKICAEAHAQGIDFTQANVHTGKGMPMKDHHVAYLGEKLACIYGPSIENARALLDAMLGERAKEAFQDDLARELRPLVERLNDAPFSYGDQRRQFVNDPLVEDSADIPVSAALFERIAALISKSPAASDRLRQLMQTDSTAAHPPPDPSGEKSAGDDKPCP